MKHILDICHQGKTYQLDVDAALKSRDLVPTTYKIGQRFIRGYDGDEYLLMAFSPSNVGLVSIKRGLRFSAPIAVTNSFYVSEKELLELTENNNWGHQETFTLVEEEDPNIIKIPKDDKTFKLDIASALKSGSLSVPAAKTYHVGQRFFFKNMDLPEEEYILGRVEKNTVTLLDLKHGNPWFLRGVGNSLAITQQEMDSIFTADGRYPEFLKCFSLKD